MFLTGASHPCLPLRVEALEAAQKAKDLSRPDMLIFSSDHPNGITHEALVL